MSEEIERSGEQIGDPVAVSLALAGASRSKADAFLDDERHHLHEQERHMRLKLWELRMGVFLRGATACMGMAVAAGLGLIVWNASNSNGLIIEPFSVPPDMADKGLNGQMVASQMLDRLNVIGATSNSYRPPRSFTNNWGNNVRVDIPDTGISVSDAYRLLRNVLGHDIYISGEVYRSANGITVTVRATGNPAGSFSGAENELDGLVQKAAEHVYASTQLYRYAGYLRVSQRRDEARPIYGRLTQEGSKLERSWAWIGLATLDNATADVSATIEDTRRSIAITPNYTFGYYYLGNLETGAGQSEAALTARREADRLLSRESVADIFNNYVPSMRLWNSYWTAFYQGDYVGAAQFAGQSADLSIVDLNNSRDSFRGAAGTALALAHDPEGAQRLLAELPHNPLLRGSQGVGIATVFISRAPLVIAAAKADWRGLLASQGDSERSLTAMANASHMDRTMFWPLFALAKAELGDASGAERLIEDTPGDCYDCLRTRGTIAALAGQAGQADYWFTRAVKSGPSIPTAYSDWGTALLARGKPDEAIAQFTIANEKGPHFADPLEGWGEALMVKNQSHLALAKFAEAEKYAPNWGRLHLKWGEALYYAGRGGEAKAQFDRAATLDLTPSEKAELAQHP